MTLGFTSYDIVKRIQHFFNTTSKNADFLGTRLFRVTDTFNLRTFVISNVLSSLFVLIKGIGLKWAFYAEKCDTSSSVDPPSRWLFRANISSGDVEDIMKAA
ncbi:hypothetical protein HI914_04016 [Erysiphe necator]|nr:hypothetical protein HI914_04016 [Erysiphe necator]